ncbi:MAG TPA: tetratricopeptide repeat protein, partial [Chthoniobacterales bacterium]
EYLSIAGLLVVAGMVAACCKRSPGQRLRVFGAAWALLAYLPTSNIVELNATVAEHWLYLPSVGLLIFLAGCALDLPIRYRKGLAFAASLAVVALGARSAVRSSDWVDPETFYTRTIAAGGGSARLSVNLALIYSNRGDFAKAEVLLRKLVQSQPDFPVARNNLANALQRQGKVEEAEKLFAAATASAGEARKEYPHTWVAAVNLARLLHAKSDDAGAIAVLEKARLDYPKTWEVICYHAELLNGTQGARVALPLVEDFVSRNWWHYDAQLARARLLAQAGDVEAAIAAFRFAGRLDVNNAEPFYAIACLQLQNQRVHDAFESQRRAVARQPDEPRQYLLLSDILERLGRHEEAQATVAQVQRLRALAQATPL